MKKKLTLTIEESVIDRAKRFVSQKRDTSISEMVENFLDSETKEETGFTPEPGSWVESMMGIAKLPDEYKDMDYKQVREKQIRERYGK